MRRFAPDRFRTARLWTFLALLLFVQPLAAFAQLRVVTYNTTGPPDPGMDIVLRSIGEELRNGIAKPIDVLLLQEQSRSSGLPDAQAFVTLLNTIYSGQTSLGLPITYARGNLIGFGDTTQSIVYRVQTVDLVGETSVGASGGTNAQPRAAVRHQIRPDGYTSTDANIYIYNSHYKAGDAADDPANLLKRDTEAKAIRANSNPLGNANAIYAGDHNFYTAGEAAFQTLVADGNGKAVDPLGLTQFDNISGTSLNGEWHNNSSVAYSHSQSPCTSGCGTTGGMDDRFDFQLTTEELDDGEGLSMIDGSYHAFGNGGNICCNSAINVATNSVTFPGVTSHTKSQILNALATVTDHIPVVADYQLPSVLSAIASSVPATLNMGDVFNLDLTVSNAANVLQAIGADELDYSITTAFNGALQNFSSFNQTDLALGTGNVYQILLDTATPGMKTDVLTIASASQAVQNALIQIQISYEVLATTLTGDFNGDHIVDASDYTTWRDGFGTLYDEDDYLDWKNHFGQSLGGSGSLAAVPEPGTAVLFVLGACLALFRPVTLRAWNRPS